MRNGTRKGRLGDINEFEVYNMGHLFTSACLYKRITGKENFLNIARKAADFLENMYAEAEKKGKYRLLCARHITWDLLKCTVPPEKKIPGSGTQGDCTA